MTSTKGKSRKRFEQLNRLVDEVGPTLENPSQLAVLMVCYRHARERGHFQVSAKRIALACKLSVRQVKRIMDKLEHLGVIELVKEHQGTIPPKYRITGRLANGDTHDTIRKCLTPDGMVTPMSVDGDTGDR